MKRQPPGQIPPPSPPASPDEDPGPTYEVGYKKPPEHTRFKPGRSGNPRGRPRGSRNVLTLVRKILDETVFATENGQKKRMSKREIAVRTCVAKAVKGDQKAIEQLMEWDERASRLHLQPSEARIAVRFVTPKWRKGK